MERTLRRYFVEATAAEAAGDAGYRYVRRTHAPEVIGPQWVQLVERLLGGRE
jgi:hypothetical protein